MKLFIKLGYIRVFNITFYKLLAFAKYFIYNHIVKNKRKEVVENEKFKG